MAPESVQSLERALAILAHLCHGERPAGVTELANRLGLPKSTVHRLLSALERAGVVTRTGNGAYRPGLKLWEMGCAVVRGLNLRDVARPIVEDLMRRTGETVHLSVWDQREVVYIDKVDGPNPIRVYSTLGGRAPSHATASGLAFLAFLDPEAHAQMWKGGLRRFTERTITSPERLRRKLEEVRRDGYAYSVGAWYSGSAGVAAPVFSHTGGVVAVLSLASPAERIVGRIRALGRVVRGAAEEISRALGAPASQQQAAARIVRRKVSREIGSSKA